MKKCKMTGFSSLFFKNGRIMLELILHQSDIKIKYIIIDNELRPIIYIIFFLMGGSKFYLSVNSSHRYF